MVETEGEARGGDYVRLPESDEELLRECEAETFRSGGPGGQHQNKTETAVRLRHLPSGIVVTCREERSQHRNKMNCLRKLRKEISRMNYRPRRGDQRDLPALPESVSLKRRLDAHGSKS